MCSEDLWHFMLPVEQTDPPSVLTPALPHDRMNGAPPPSIIPVPLCRFHPPLALRPPGTAPAAGWTLARAWEVWTGFSGGGAGAGTPPGSGGSTGIPAGGTGGTGGTGETGDTGTAAAGTPRFADPTGKRGREDRPPQTRAGTASWPACVLRGEEEEDVVGRTREGGRTGGRYSNKRRRR